MLIQGKQEKWPIQDLSGSSEITVGSWRWDPLPSQSLQREGREGGVFLEHIPCAEASLGVERPWVDFSWEKNSLGVWNKSMDWTGAAMWIKVFYPVRIPERCSKCPALVGTLVLQSVQGICSLGFEIFTNTEPGSAQAQLIVERAF